MDRVAEIRKYIEWTEEQVLAGNASPTVEQYEEALRVTDLERAFDAIQVILLGEASEAEKLHGILEIAFPAVAR